MDGMRLHIVKVVLSFKLQDLLFKAIFLVEGLVDSTN